MSNEVEIVVSSRNRAAGGFTDVKSAVASMKMSIGGAMRSVKEDFNAAGHDAEKMGAEVRIAGHQASEAGNEMSNASGHARNLGSSLEGVKGKAAAMGYAIKAAAIASTVAIAAAATAIVGFGIKQAAANQTAMVSFELLLGSAQNAQAFLKKLSDFAARTPFDLPTLKDAASRLLAVGVHAEDVIPIMTRLGDATAGMGTGAEGISRAVYALQQMKQAGKASLDDINQLTDAGIPALDALAAHFHTTVANIRAMVSKGKISADDVYAAIEGGEGPAFARLKGMMDKQSATLEGVWSTLKDNISQTLAKTFEPAIPSLTKAVNWIGTNVPKAIAAITKDIKGIVDFIVKSGLADEIKNVFEGFKYGDNLKKIKGDAAKLVTEIKAHWPEIKEIILVVAGAIGLVVKLVLKLIDVVLKVDRVMVDVWSGLVRVINKVGLAYLDILSTILHVAAKIPGDPLGAKKMASDVDAAKDKINKSLNGIKNYVPVAVDPHLTHQTLTVNIGAVVGSAAAAAALKAITGHAAGGVANGLSMINESGPELVRLPNGSTVIPAGTSRNVLAAASNGSSSNGASEMRITGDASSAFATFFKKLARDGLITFYDSTGKKIKLA